MPAVDALPVPYKIVQTPRLILLLYEVDTVFRQIFTDGRSPVKDPEPAIGHLVPEDDLLEYFCSDNEKDVQHFR